MKILQLNTSVISSGANSTRLANTITARLKKKHPGAEVMLRDFARTPPLPLDEFTLAARMTPAEQRTYAQTTRLEYDDTLIAELKAADILVLGVPMYNFHIPVQLKAWIDAVAQSGATFRYTENGPQGLLTGKKAYVALTRGGMYRGTAADHQVPYLKGVFEFIGITEIEFVYAEGLSMGETVAKNSIWEAEESMNQLFS